MKLESLKPGISLIGIEATLVATVIAVVPIGDGAVQVIYKTPEGTLKDRLLGRADLPPPPMLVVPHHPTPRAKYPVIDVHTHVSSVFPRRRAAGSPDMAKAFRQIDAIAGWMETLNIRTMLNLTGGYGDLLKQNISDLQDRYKALQHSRKLRQSIQESKLHMEGPFRLESALEILF